MTNWESMSTQELKERLKTELDADISDRDAVMAIMDELERREPVKEIPVEVLARWAAFQNRKKKKESRWKPVWKAAIAAVLAVALLGIVPTAMGKENIFQVVSRWTRELFCFGETESTEFVFETDHPGLQELYDTVTDLGVTENVVPTWLPDGYETQKIIEKTAPKGIMILANYAKGKREIQISISICNEHRVVQYQKDENIVDTLEHEGTTTYVVKNNERFGAIWQEGNVECSIYADSKEDLYRIIDSIY